MKKIHIYFLYGFLLLMAIIFSLLSCGCSRSVLTDELQVPRAIRIKDSGFSNTARPDGLTDCSIGLEIENENEDFINCNASVRVTYKDADGAVLVSREEILPVIFAQTVQGFGKTSAIAGVPASVDFELVLEDAFFIPKTSCLLYNGLRVENLSTTTFENQPAISGTIVNNNDEMLAQTMIFAVFRNAEGKITGGSNEIVRCLKAESSLPFSVLCKDRDLNTESFTVTASCWYQYLPITMSYPTS